VDLSNRRSCVWTFVHNLLMRSNFYLLDQSFESSWNVNFILLLLFNRECEYVQVARLEWRNDRSVRICSSTCWTLAVILSIGSGYRPTEYFLWKQLKWTECKSSVLPDIGTFMFYKIWTHRCTWISIELPLLPYIWFVSCAYNRCSRPPQYLQINMTGFR
jgi:hypothetical protein